MKSRPLLFQGAMVRATLDDSKTQTRRVAKLTDAGHVKEPRGHRRWHPADPKAKLACLYGQPGDQLWVREAWRTSRVADELKPSQLVGGGYSSIWYEAQNDVPFHPSNFGKLRPSMFMPRWASRITLEITGVRVERLQDISRGDAMAEGCPFPNMAQGADPRNWYADLWNSINGPDSWDANPWVWVVEFKRVKP